MTLGSGSRSTGWLLLKSGRWCMFDRVVTTLLRGLRLLGVGQVQGGLQATRELDRIVVRPEVHVEQPRGVAQAVIVQRRRLDTVLPKRLGDAIHLTGDEDEIAGDRRLAVAGGLEVERRIDALAGQQLHAVLGDLLRARRAELQYAVVHAAGASERGLHLFVVDRRAATR